MLIIALLIILYLGEYMKYFVSADIHGFLNEWTFALKEKGFDINNNEHKIIVCGDLFDRGSQAKELQSFVMDLIEKDKIILIKGNHEDLAIELVENYAKYMFEVKYTHHYHNGTFQTILELIDLDFTEATTCLYEFKRRARQTDYIKNIIPKMLDYYETSNYVFVHAWVPLKEGGYEFDENWRNANVALWERARWTNPLQAYQRGLYPKDKTLVFGHYHCSSFWASKYPKKYTQYGKTACHEPYITKQIIALDSCAVDSKKVNVVVIED